MKNSVETQPEPIPVFWGEIAPGEHFVQFYEDHGAFRVLGAYPAS